jgi:hypothetical protein
MNYEDWVQEMMNNLGSGMVESLKLENLDMISDFQGLFNRYFVKRPVHKGPPFEDARGDFFSRYLCPV